MGKNKTTGWQPIDTAPRDGTAIFVCCKVFMCPEWHPDEVWSDRWGPTCSSDDTEFGWQFAADAPTHWMPIPPKGGVNV